MYTQIDEQTGKKLVYSSDKMTPAEAFSFVKDQWAQNLPVDFAIVKIGRKLYYSKQIQRLLERGAKPQKSKRNSRLPKLTPEQREQKRIIRANENYYREWSDSDSRWITHQEQEQYYKESGMFYVDPDLGDRS